MRSATPRNSANGFACASRASFTRATTIIGQVTYPGYEHLKLDMQVVELVPERYFSYRWRPNAIDASKDYSEEPMTLVEFTLDEAPGGNGTLLTIVESGFARLPPSAARRPSAATTAAGRNNSKTSSAMSKARSSRPQTQ